MTYVQRTHSIHRIQISNGSNTSQVCDLREGVFGTIIVPSGSDAIGKTIQFIATEGELIKPSSKSMPDTALLATPKTLAAGSNPLTSDEIAQVGAAGYVKFQLGSNAGSDVVLYLLWKA